MSGKIRELGEVIHKVTEESLNDSGYVLSIETGLTAVDGCVKKATASYYEPYGVNYKSTEDPLAPGTYKSGVETAIVRDGVVDVQVAAHAARTTAIAIGDPVAVLDLGKVAHLTDTPATVALAAVIHDNVTGAVMATYLTKYARLIVGYAEEALGDAADPADGEGKINVRLTIR